MENLRGKTLSGLFWNFSGKMANKLVAFIPTIFLARLLAPEQFGLIGMLTVFIAVSNTFLDGGFVPPSFKKGPSLISTNARCSTSICLSAGP